MDIVILILVSGMAAALILFGVTYWIRDKRIKALSLVTGGLFFILLSSMTLVSAVADRIMMHRFQTMRQDVMKHLELIERSRKLVPQRKKEDRST